MKKLTFLRKAVQSFALLLATFAVFPEALAQVIVPPALPDNFVGPFGYPNSSTIDYSNFFPAPNPQFTAMVTDGGPGGPAPQLFVNDAMAGPGWVPAPIPIPPGCWPDVIVGNDMTVPGNLLIAVVATVPCGGANDVMLFLYNEAGPAPYVAPPALIGVFNLSGTCNVSGPAHIDIIDEYSTPWGGPALPLANKFAVTWKDNGLGIMGMFANLNAPVAPVAIINPNLALSSPDVAAVERLGGGFEDWAMFTYVDQTVFPNLLFRQDWRMAPILPPAPPVLWDNTVNYVGWPSASTVRIDAIDDFTQNVPGGGNATFDVVASVPLATPPFGAAIYQYNDVVGPFPPPALADITSPIPGLAGNKNVLPQVTAGPGAYYSIGYHSYGPMSPMNYYVQAVDWPTGTPFTTPNAYNVNTAPFGFAPAWSQGICVSGTHNTNVCPVEQLFVGWESAGSNWFKYNAAPCVPYFFKPAPGTETTSPATAEWQLSPNPATDHVTLTAPAGFNKDAGARYSITDLSGRRLLQGTMHETQLTVNVSQLPAGMYMLQLQNGDVNAKTMKFVKE